jgi:hypothetical protein
MDASKGRRNTSNPTPPLDFENKIQDLRKKEICHTFIPKIINIEKEKKSRSPSKMERLGPCQTSVKV